MEKTGGHRYLTQKLPEYDFMADTFIASKLRPYVEEQRYTAQVVGDLGVKNLYDAGVKQGILPQPSELFAEFEINKLQSYIIKEYRGDPNAMLTYKAFRAKETLPVDGTLMPSEKHRVYKRLLKEALAKLAQMKESETKNAALLQMEKLKAEKEYQAK